MPTTSSNHSWVYTFGQGQAQGSAEMKLLLGGKGANLAEMNHLGLPVPPGFTITTQACRYFFEHQTYPEGLNEHIQRGLDWIESIVPSKLGDPRSPLLVSVRSGAPASMPGMMDTILNLGLNDQTVQGLAILTQNPRFAYDSYRRFIQMYGHVVLGVDASKFDDALDQHKHQQGYDADPQMAADDWKSVVDQFQAIVLKHTGNLFPQNVHDQLHGAIRAVFASWGNRRAITYRKLHNIPESWGTAVNIQAMVFGNMGEDCATGVAFTRNPSTGAPLLYGEYLTNAQGEDVVAGIRNPLPIMMHDDHGQAQTNSLEERDPQLVEELLVIRKTLERHFRDMQDIEFTVQNGKLWILQTRNGKRTAQAAIKIAVDLCHQGIITKNEALMRVDPNSLHQLLHPSLDPNAPRIVLTQGLPASPGAISGQIVFDADEAERQSQSQRDVILVRVETSPDDIHGMHAAKGILTTRGGMTSHAAVVARGMGRPCVCGANQIQVDEKNKTMTVGSRILHVGDWITLNGATGEVFLGPVPTVQPKLSGDFGEFMSWADEARSLTIRANADTPKDTETALRFGAEGIGLCRTEHMFFEPARILAVRQMIFSENTQERMAALEQLLPMQRADFIEIFERMNGLPVTVRLLDPPLHEFLPHHNHEYEELADYIRKPITMLQQMGKRLHEANPMLGHRGCRLGITYPEIYQMQSRALFEALVDVEKRTQSKVLLEIMLPLIATHEELAILKHCMIRVAQDIEQTHQHPIQPVIGTMIELPRAAIIAESIAEIADFFSFGTNDLTQSVLGLSRDDAGNFLDVYLKQGIFPADPFTSLDVKGVGVLVDWACQQGRKTNPKLKLGICGEHGGDPSSIQFFHRIGLHYVSCSPYRVPIARLAAAQAAIASSQQDEKPISIAATA